MIETVDDRVVVLALVPTQSEPGAFYILAHEGCAVTCSCPAFRFSRAAPKTCKHMAALWAALNGERVDDV